MTTSSFLDTAATRADSLRELSRHLHSLAWTSASLEDVEGEIPDLDVAISVYRRLNGAGTSGQEDQAAFLDVAEDRVGRLRQITTDMNSLDWAHASLSDIESEIPELDTAMAVYRRLTEAPQAEPREPASYEPEQAYAAAPREAESTPAPAPSFSQFALQSLDSPATSPAHETAEVNGSR